MVPEKRWRTVEKSVQAWVQLLRHSPKAALTPYFGWISSWLGQLLEPVATEHFSTEKRAAETSQQPFLQRSRQLSCFSRRAGKKLFS